MLDVLEPEFRESLFMSLIEHLDSRLYRLSKVMTKNGFKLTDEEDPRSHHHQHKAFATLTQWDEQFRYVVRLDMSQDDINELILFETYGFCRFVRCFEQKSSETNEKVSTIYWLMYFNDDVLGWIS